MPNGGPITQPGMGGGEPRYAHSGDLVYPYNNEVAPKRKKARGKKKKARKK